jgi:hypothetical protein
MSGTIGVLLPARLETRFDQDTAGHWILRFLVVPGAASIDNHDPATDRDEIARLAAAAKQCNGDFTSEEGAAAFDGLAGELGASRALWLVRTHLLRNGADWSVSPDAPPREEVRRAAATIRGLPEELELWAETSAGSSAVHVHTLTRAATDLPIEPPQPDEPVTFWTGWDTLYAAGLADSVDLTEKGIDPESITRLLLVGVGTTPAAALFQAHADAGQATLLRPGTPTNVTAGSGGHPAPTTADVRALLLDAPGVAGSSANADLARALTGSPEGLSRLVGGDHSHRTLQQALVRAVWPALWGHATQDLWGPGEGWPAHELGRWITEHFLPQGPLPTVLIDDQPYGVLPLTPLSRAADGSDPVEDRLGEALNEVLRATHPLATEERDTVVGADAERLLRVVGTTPVSQTWTWRWSIPLQATAPPGPVRDAVKHTHEHTLGRFLGAAGLDPESPIAPPVAVGRQRQVGLPAAGPSARSDDPTSAFQWDLFMDWWDELRDDADPRGEELRAVLEQRAKDEPLRILFGYLWKRVRDARERPDTFSVAGALEGFGDPWPDSLIYRLAHLSLREVWRWGRWVVEGQTGPPDDETRFLDQLNETWPQPWANGADPGWVVEVMGALTDALLDVAVVDHGRPGDVELAAAALLDCATHRLDPWAVGMAWRRLERRDEAERVLGLYGFVDTPFRGEPGPGDRGLVLAPSPDQVKTSAIVRDRAVAQHASGVQPARWDMPLDSERVRTALRLARTVREGAHPAEAWGREYERLLPDDAKVRTFRDQYSAHTSDAGRRTCDGLKVSQAFLEGRLEAEAGFAPRDLTLDRFKLLAGATADLADLLVLEAVHDTVTGGVSQTSVALDAAAGLTVPPEFRFPTTPAGGMSLRTTVTLAIPDVAPGQEPSPTGPGDADPAVSRLLNQSFGDLAGKPWSWRYENRRVSLADLGLTVADLVVADDDTLAGVAAGALGAPASEVTPPPRLPDARRLIAVLARCTAPSVTLPAPVVQRLSRRRARLEAAARDLLAALEAADPSTELHGALATRALRWGLRGEAGPAAARLAQHHSHATAQGDPIGDLRRLAGIGRGTDGSALVPVLVPTTVPPVGPGVADGWLETFALVRPALTPVPASWQWRRHVEDDPWTGRPDAHTKARESDVVVTPSTLPGETVVGILDSWVETIPDRDVPATGAFSFPTPRARAPQAILLAVPSTDIEDVPVGLALDVVRQAARLARTRSLPPHHLGALGALLPSAHLPAGERGGIDLPGIPRLDGGQRVHVRLEPGPPPPGIADRALRAEVADPVWMLARQWQMGEHAGENRSSPVRYDIRASHTPLRAPRGRPALDPRAWPGEVALEGAATDVRIGQQPAAARGPDPWDPVALWYGTELLTRGSNRAPLSARDHDGGAADWWSLDLGAAEATDPPAFTPARRRVRYAGLPGLMHYPGAPDPGWFTMEDPDQTVIGHMPDPAHVASLFFLDVIGGHATDWYLARLATPPGHVLSVHSLEVEDSFGNVWPFDPWPADADAWTTPFRTRWLRPQDLLVWFPTTRPLEGDVLEQVLLGLDEDADVLWAVEERVDGHDAPPPAAPPPTGAASGSDQVTATRRVRYQVAAPSPGPWHPYPAETPDELPRLFRQGRLRVLGPKGRPKDNPLPDASSRFLRVVGTLPEIDPAGVPASGLRLERRWVVARGRDGRPVAWQQRRRVTPASTPVFPVGHDRTFIMD